MICLRARGWRRGHQFISNDLQVRRATFGLQGMAGTLAGLWTPPLQHTSRASLSVHTCLAALSCRLKAKQWSWRRGCDKQVVQVPRPRNPSLLRVRAAGAGYSGSPQGPEVGAKEEGTDCRG